MIAVLLLLAGAATATAQTTLTFGMDTNYPPYAYKNATTGELEGFGKDVAEGMNALCSATLNIQVVETAWENCWSSSAVLGALLDNGTLDACMTYTHTQGVRNDYAEFGDAILEVNKAAGLLTLLQKGYPMVGGHSDLAGLKVVDVAGWAPTADGLGFVENKCTSSMYSSNYTLLSGDGNDEAMTMLRNGSADAMFVYADQAYNYQCTGGVSATWNCSLWSGFGTEYAYVQTGQFGYVVNGTTLVMSKKGSGVAALTDSCLQDFIETEDYYKLCVKHDLVDSCYHNSFFPSGSDVVHEYNKPTDEHTTDCSDGYCSCATPAYSDVTFLTFGMDVNYPPYAFKNATTGELEGLGKDIAEGMNALCPNLHIDVVETLWENCWSSSAVLGSLLDDGTLDGCMTYTHTQGVRNTFAEFGDAILEVNKAAGLLTLLKDGLPMVGGHSDLSGVKVVDVAGWAPTADGLQFVENKCTGTMYSSDYTLLSGDGNDKAMQMLRDGTADAMFVYADQAYNYQCTGGVSATWNCTLWSGFGTEYAYVQTGQFGYVVNGTTLVMSKLGSGVAALTNPCLQEFLETEEYYKLCVKHNSVDSCYHNSFFPQATDEEKEYNKPTDEHTTNCSDGYCSCDTPAYSGNMNQTMLTFGMDVNYPPYAFKNATTGALEGFGKDVAEGMNELCPELHIDVVETLWENCWSASAVLGGLLDDGTLDACMTYTHTQGVRNDYAEFGDAILEVNKAAGLLTLLDERGVPHVTGQDDLSGKTVVDVAGWAPTADGLGFVENKCTSSMYSSNYTLLSGDGNDASMRMLRDGTADAMFVYADQAHNYQCSDGVSATWNCSLWAGFGTEYAYVQTGQFGYVQNGTTLVMSKKGSGVANLTNPCLQRFMETEAYYKLCVKHDLVDSCYHNSFFPQGADEVHEYNKPTHEHSGDCSNGYCPCTYDVGSGASSVGPVLVRAAMWLAPAVVLQSMF